MGTLDKLGDPIANEVLSWLTQTYNLEPLEAEVLRCFLEDKTEKEAADELGTSKYAVHGHARYLYAKLGVMNRTQLRVRIETKIRDEWDGA